MTSLAKDESFPVAGLRRIERDGVVVVTLDRPPANALDRSLLRAMTALFRDWSEGATPPVVITGAGRFFCAGGDIKEVDGAAAAPITARMQAFHDLLVAMDRYPGPVIAAVNGDCIGGGLEYALFADAVLAAPHVRFGFPEIRHGLLPADKGIQRLIRLVGMRPARELLLGGELVGAEQALRWGLIDAIVESDRLVSEALAWAQGAGRRAPILYAALKQALNEPDDLVDQARAGTTLSKAARWIDDPQARRLRDGWRRVRAPSRPGDVDAPSPDTNPNDAR